MSDPKQMLGELGRHDRSHSINCTFTPCDCGRHDELSAKIATALDCEKYHADGWEEADLECERLRAIVLKYGDHDDGCPGRVDDECTCGYLEALETEEVRDVRPRCDRCKWWEKNDHDEKGACGRTPDESGLPFSMLFEIDDPYCSLVTAPEFGCVEFESRKAGAS